MKYIRLGLGYLFGVAVIFGLWSIWMTSSGPVYTFTQFRGRIVYPVRRGTTIEVKGVTGKVLFELRQIDGGGHLEQIGSDKWVALDGNVTAEVSANNPVHVTIGGSTISPLMEVLILAGLVLAWTALLVLRLVKPRPR